MERQHTIRRTALREEDGDFSVQVVRGEDLIATAVQPLETQGGWTIVAAPALIEGDTVVGQVASYVDEQQDVSVSY